MRVTRLCDEVSPALSTIRNLLAPMVGYWTNLQTHLKNKRNNKIFKIRGNIALSRHPSQLFKVKNLYSTYTLQTMSCKHKGYFIIQVSLKIMHTLGFIKTETFMFK